LSILLERKQEKVMNEKALNTFVGKISEIKERLDELQQFVDNHMEFAPEDIHWGHVGTAEHYLKELTELTDMAFKRGDYATSWELE
jgi:hypothetical protein